MKTSKRLTLDLAVSLSLSLLICISLWLLWRALSLIWDNFSRRYTPAIIRNRRISLDLMKYNTISLSSNSLFKSKHFISILDNLQDLHPHISRHIGSGSSKPGKITAIPKAPVFGIVKPFFQESQQKRLYRAHSCCVPVSSSLVHDTCIARVTVGRAPLNLRALYSRRNSLSRPTAHILTRD